MCNQLHMLYRQLNNFLSQNNYQYSYDSLSLYIPNHMLFYIPIYHLITKSFLCSVYMFFLLMKLYSFLCINHNIKSLQMYLNMKGIYGLLINKFLKKIISKNNFKKTCWTRIYTVIFTISFTFISLIII